MPGAGSPGPASSRAPGEQNEGPVLRDHQRGDKSP